MIDDTAVSEAHQSAGFSAPHRRRGRPVPVALNQEDLLETTDGGKYPLAKLVDCYGNPERGSGGTMLRQRTNHDARSCTLRLRLLITVN